MLRCVLRVIGCIRKELKPVSVYSNTEIRQAIREGIIVCDPFVDSNVAEASLDVILGNYYYQMETVNEGYVFNPFCGQEVSRYFKGPFKAEKHNAWVEGHGRKLFKNIPVDHPIIVLQPGERILGHTHEFVGIRALGGACRVMARSSMGRIGIAVCFDAGWIDPGYINRITLEIYNLNKRPVVLPVGERVAQIIFERTGPVEGSYEEGRSGRSGKYQVSADLDELKRTWSPEQMLPRNYMDNRTLPKPIIGLNPEYK